MAHVNYLRRHGIAKRPDIKFPRTLTPQSWTPNQIFAAYGLPKLTGPITPQTIGIVELGGGRVPNNAVAAFQSFGLPTPEVTDVSVQGGTNSPGDPADGEVELDVQWAAAAYSYMTGQPANIRVYFAPNSDAGFLGCFQAIRTDKCSVGSCSWGSPEDGWDSNSIKNFAAELAQHILAGIYNFAASGDNDSGDGESGIHCDYPASDPSMIGCGGTTKTRTTETVWNNGNGEGTGGGYSAVFPIQPWQVGAPNGPGRMVPDVAANADPDTGYPVWIGGVSQVIGGTSAVAPIMAGIFAALKGWLIGAAKVPPLNLLEWLWSHPSAWGDIVVGNNGQWKALSGPDPCTGLGVPNGANLLAAISGGTTTQPPPPPPPPPPVMVTVPNIVSDTFNVAKLALSNVGLIISPPTVADPSAIIATQSPPAVTSVAKGSTVTITLKSVVVPPPPPPSPTITFSHPESAGTHEMTGGGLHRVTLSANVSAGTYKLEK